MKKDISIEQLAQLENMSPRSLYKLFERTPGTAPKSLYSSAYAGADTRPPEWPPTKIQKLTDIATIYGFFHLRLSLKAKKAHLANYNPTLCASDINIICNCANTF